MKKLSFKKLFFIIPAILSLFSGLFLVGSRQTSFADTLASIPDYFNVYVGSRSVEENNNVIYEKRSITQFKNGDAVFLKSDEALVLEFDKTKNAVINQQTGIAKVSGVNYTLTINGRLYSGAVNESKGFEFLNNEIFKLAINPNLATDNFEYGKYSMMISYTYTDENYNNTTNQFSLNFYVLNFNDYFADVKTFENYTTSANHYYSSNFNQEKLLSLTFKYTSFNVNIVKLHQQLSYTTSIKYINGDLQVINTNEQGQTINSENVLVKKLDDNKAKIVFKDLGSYYITYETINPNNNNEVFSQYGYYGSGQGAPNTPTNVDVFGYQAFITTDSGLLEFKRVDAEVVEASADITSKKQKNELLETAKNLSDKIAKTNQAPVYFRTNAELKIEGFKSLSNYYYFESVDALQDPTNLPNKVEDYRGAPLSKAGVYIVELSYKFNAGDYTQYFLFEISNDSPKIELQEVQSYNEANEPVLSTNTVVNDYVTCRDIVVGKQKAGIFDSKSVLKIFKSTNFNTEELNNNANAVVVEDKYVLTDTARYKLELSYGTFNQKKYVTYFTIDKTGISDVQVHSLKNQIGTLYQKDKVLDGDLIMSNTPVAISWNAKGNGQATTYAEYKYFPTNFSSAYANSLSSEQLKNYYNYYPNTRYAIPSTHTFAYSGENMPVSDYTNAKDILIDNNILSGGGFYIVKIFDQTARIEENDKNVIYKMIFVDTTKTNIISSVKNNWTITKDAQITSDDYSLYFGSHKIIQFENLNPNPNGWDLWFKAMYSKPEISSYFTVNLNKLYFKIPTNKTVHYIKSENGITTNNVFNLTTANSYSITENAMKSAGVPNEANYDYYFTLVSNALIENNLASYKNYFDARHNVTFSTDKSQMMLSYKDQENNEWLMQQFNVRQSGETKKNYYNPTAKNTLKDEIIKFKYTTEPEVNLSVESIVMEYYAFEKSAYLSQGKSTYVFLKEPTATITIYEKDLINLGQLVSGLSTYSWDLYIENYIEDAIQKQRTRSGKYIITRTYVEPQNAYDPKIRQLEFIVDRNGIISEPDIDKDGNALYYTGGAIKLQVLHNYQTIERDKTLFFHDIYFANQMMGQNETSSIPVLKTNLLPVTLYVPQYKYGYDNSFVANNQYKFIYSDTEDLFKENNNVPSGENSVVQYINLGDESTPAFYESYRLSAVVEYRNSPDLRLPATETYNYNNPLTTLGYLTTQSSNGIISFNKEGYYHVIITSVAGDRFVFDFQIEYQSPEYTLTDENNKPLGFDTSNNVYYTNKSKIRIAWQDSKNIFLANINHDAIRYELSNGLSGVIESTQIVKSGENSYYADLDLASINGGYTNGGKVAITLQFKGEESSYNPSYFKKTSIVNIDLQAPISNITRLVSQIGQNFSALREYKEGYGDKYNISKDSGLFAYYSYVIDVSNFINILKTPQETGYDFYKVYYRVFENNGLNTKYVMGNVQESEIYLNNYDDNSSTDTLFTGSLTYDHLLNSYVNKYVEIIEEDYAGNRTVYTIYITDSSKLTKDVISYKTNNAGDNNSSIKFSELSTDNTIRSKYSLNLESIDLLQNDSLFGKYFQIIKVQGETYVKTPFSADKYYKLREFTNEQDSPTYTLQQISTLYSSSSVQLIELYSVPKFEKVNLNAYVLNQMLEYHILAQYEQNENLEGILIKLPNKNIADSNVIYATNLSIIGKINSNSININISDSKLFMEERDTIKAPNYSISYVQSIDGSTYFRFELLYEYINRNSYVVYKITDVFGEVISIPHIFGQIEIKNPITSKGEIVESYDQNGDYIYYASEEIIYRYNLTIYPSARITIKKGTEFKQFIIKRDELTRTIKVYNINNGVVSQTPATESDYVDYITVNNENNGIVQLIMKPEKIDVIKGIWGNSISYVVNLELNADFKESFQETQTITNFRIYNKIPRISLLGANGDNITSILGNNGVYSKNITVSYEKVNLEFPYDVYIIEPNGTTTLLLEQYLASENGTYRIVVSYLGEVTGLSKSIEFTIKNSEDYNFIVMKVNDDGSYSEVKATGEPYTYKVIQNGNEVSKKIQTHYIVNSDYKIFLNESKNIIYNPEDITKVDNYTTIYLIHTDYSNTNVTEYYSSAIAVTKIPKTNKLFGANGFVQYDNFGNEQNLNNSTSIISPVLTENGYEAGKKIAWSNWYLIESNKIKATIYYGEIGKTVYNPIITTTKENKSTITLKSSGVYYFKFEDYAGNIHYFGAYADTDYFAVKYLSSVIFEVNDEAGINYAIYDKQVKISIPEYTLNYYDSNARPSIHVELNGKEYTPNKSDVKNQWIFSEAGLYKVWFSANIGGDAIYECPLYFTILSTKETRTIFNYYAYGDYYIEDILLNNISVNKKLANANNGILYSDNYLKDITMHINDAKTGEGKWTFVVNTNNEFKQRFSFTIWMNKHSIPVSISHANGVTTTENITISFLASNLISEAGDCIIKITGEEDIYITSDLLQNGTITDLNEIVLKNSREYFIEITTLSGQLLFSSYINKVDPLNTSSIILIVAGSVVAVAGTIIFILMRRKMKIK